jgi:endonuclease/exonuclease/phosphatase family metal-dependent hydrolase
VCDVLRRHRPEVIGLQEALRFQLDDLLAALTPYALVGVGRDDGQENGEYAAILYLSERFQVTGQGTFWLSDTPEVPGSKSWGNTIPRACTWARLRDESPGKAYYVFNTHLDHASQPARELGAELIVRRIGERSPLDPFLLMGDLNAGEDNAVVRYLKGEARDVPAKPGRSAPSPGLIDSFRALHPEAAEAGTFHSFSGNRRGARIDYILVSRSVEVLKAEIIHDHRRGRHPSDHFPVSADLSLP